MIYDLDARETKTSMMDLMRFDLPFTGVMPDEFEYNENDVRFVFSDLGISREKMAKLLDLKVRHKGIERKFAFVTVEIVRTGEYELDPLSEMDAEIIHKHTVAVFE